MAKVYTNQVTVRVWRNVKWIGPVPSGHFGHAAVTLSGIFVPTVRDIEKKIDRKRLHISFWPDGAAKWGPDAFREKPGATHGYTRSDQRAEMNRMTRLRLEIGYRKANNLSYPAEWVEEIERLGYEPIDAPRSGQVRPKTDVTQLDVLPLWSQSAEAKFELPGFMNRGRVWGLSISHMAKWWNTFKATQPSYKALSVDKNCAAIALEALRQGAAGAFVDLPTVRVYCEPVQVENVARDLQMQLDRMEKWTTDFDVDVRRAMTSGLLKPGANNQSLVGGIWGVDTWKRESALGTFQMRSPAIRAIDEALANFHRFTWKDSYQDKYGALVKLFLAISKHRQDKAYSTRSDAVLRLGAQALSIVRNPGSLMV